MKIFTETANILHRSKELLLSLSPFRNVTVRITFRLLLYFLTLTVIPFGILSLLVQHFAFAFAGLILCLLIVFTLHRFAIFQRHATRNLIFLIIFILGICSYLQLTEATPGSTEISTVENNSLARKIYLAIHNGNIAIAAFFPSRGAYEINGDGTINGAPLPTNIIGWYILFHACAYIFAGYFFMSLWGYRTINRLQFFLTRDDEKNIFWCITPTPRMMILAEDILKNAGSPSQPVFSVEENEIPDSAPLFQDMNFHDFCLKLRKPGQFHEYCITAAKHFFLTENDDWNMNMANLLLRERERKHITTQTRLYIKISDNVRELFFNRWADANNKPGEVEIILIHESEIIAGKFIQEYPMLDTVAEKIDTQTATIADAEFKVLVIGFGNIGRSVLKHIICDCQYIRSLNGTTVDNRPRKQGIISRDESEYTDQMDRVPFSADIIDHDEDVWNVFRHEFPDACQRFNLNFTQMKVLSGEFFQLQWENLKNYNRIIVALGDAVLNMEVAANLEKIIRKNIPLPGTGNAVQQQEPSEILMEIKKRLFVISPEITQQKIPGHELYHHNDNLFHLIADNYEIYRYDCIVEERLSYMARLIDLGYNINFRKKENKSADEKISFALYKQLMKVHHFPLIPSNYSFADFCHLPLNQKKRIMRSWHIKYCDGELKTATMASRKSSRAAAANLRNILLLLGLNDESFSTHYDNRIAADPVLKNTLGRTEHLRWIAFSLLEGNTLWKNPVKNDQFEKANQSIPYYRHAALVEWDELPELDRIFSEGKTFRKKDLEIIENLAMIYQEYCVQNKKE